MKPRIGLSMNYRVNEDAVEQIYLDKDYFEMVEEAGALPFPLAPTENVLQLDAILHHLDGVLLTGGRDIDPLLWQERQHPETILLHPRRQRFEFMLYQQAQKHKLPILAICLGIQVVNVAHGGTLFQHLPDYDAEDPVEHRGDDETAFHEVRLNRGSRLFQWFQTDCLRVNSYHHQAINQLGHGLLASAVADDGIVEAVERQDYPFLLALQWHPERDRRGIVTTTIMEQFLDAASAKTQPA
jgi:putative glutamine amidotransferase